MKRIVLWQLLVYFSLKNNGIIMNRRQFMQRLLQLSAVSSLSPAANLTLIRQAVADTPQFSDYRALVCVFLYGGNDAYNMFVPMGSMHSDSYATYQNVRGSLSVSNNDLNLNALNLNAATLSANTGNPYYSDASAEKAYLKGLYPLSGKNIGVNGLMPELAQLLSDDKASIVANVGTLVEQVNRSQVINETGKLPLFLFSHNHQQRQLQIGRADTLEDIGWAGRIADQWAGVNQNSPLGLNISIEGNDRMLIGSKRGPLVLRANEVPQFQRMQSSDNNYLDRRALFNTIAGNTSSSANVNLSHISNDITSGYRHLINQFNLNALQTTDALANAWNANNPIYTSTNVYGDPLFSVPTAEKLGFDDADISGRLINQLATVAKLIWLGANGYLGTPYNRQIFYVQLGGFDTHGNQLKDHPLLLRELSIALWDFHKALADTNLSDKVATFTMSDFGRTLSNNGDGTDHAWGSHQIVMHGNGANAGLNMGQLYGNLPDIQLGSDDDYSDRGRFIPTLAQDQLSATLSSWFGVSDQLMPTIFPNLANFQNGSSIRDAFVSNMLS